MAYRTATSGCMTFWLHFCLFLFLNQTVIPLPTQTDIWLLMDVSVNLKWKPDEHNQNESE